ncbi:hypothetical protein IOC48_07485 [Vibrio vulnificus]|nr:hypothetical protein [Vibrio vulnificus]MCD1418490.1 hypothetical protein [Vibrio vulnificus]MCD1437996.1 hypothetical protein [Vibrio vulnificus]MCD1442511.1 hypothetical protein [Vibrio vulnificus]
MDEKVQIAFGVWAGVSLLGYVHESFQFFGFWLLFVNQSRVNLVFSKT